jgi:S1-C subfamily serine protease
MVMAETQTSDALVGLSDALANAVEKASLATVAVHARRRFPATGLVIGNGLVVTANHVVERDEEITIALHDGSSVPATLVGRDPGSDLAVLRVGGDLPAPLTEATAPRVGNLVLAIGRGLGVGASLGLINAVDGPQRTRRGGQLDGLIRADATLLPGFSGGPLIDAQGRVLGINTSGMGGGAGVTIPIATVSRVAAALAQHGKIKRGFLGVASQPVAVNEAQAAALDGQKSGLLVVGVEQSGPADKGGMIVGDIIVRLAGEQVAQPDDLQRLLTGERIGQATAITVLRGGARHELTVSIGERP